MGLARGKGVLLPEGIEVVPTDVGYDRWSELNDEECRVAAPLDDEDAAGGAALRRIGQRTFILRR
jgi:hypothetical protein